MYKLDLERAEEPEIKLPRSVVDLGNGAIYRDFAENFGGQI